MQVHYDDKDDILYIRLREVPLGLSEDIEEGVTVDVDEHGAVIGVEDLDASERLDAQAVAALAAFQHAAVS